MLHLSVKLYERLHKNSPAGEAEAPAAEYDPRGGQVAGGVAQARRQEYAGARDRAGDGAQRRRTCWQVEPDGCYRTWRLTSRGSFLSVELSIDGRLLPADGTAPAGSTDGRSLANIAPEPTGRWGIKLPYKHPITLLVIQAIIQALRKFRI